MKRWINKKIRFFWWLKNIVPPMWKAYNGRWYNFRDSPDLVVRTFSMMLLEAERRESSEIRNLCLDARREWQLRIQRKGF